MGFINAQMGCPANTKTLSKYLIEELVIDKKPFGIHHFTDGEAMTWYDFAKRILKENALESMVKLEKIKNYHTFVKRPKKSILAKQ